MRDPFGTWGKKRRGSNQGDQPTEAGPQHEEDSFFPTFQPPWMNDASQWNRTTPRKRTQIPAHDDEEDDEFFSYIPQEFRQYIPSRFNFPNIRSQFGRQGSHSQPAQASPRNIYYEHPNVPQQTTGSPKEHQQQPKPKYCDAAMQTDDTVDGIENENQDQSQNLNQHGLRNTVDLGQKTRDEVPEEERVPRSHSAPPQQNNNFNQANSFSSSTNNPAGPGPQTHAHAQATPGASASAYATANCGTSTGNESPNFYRQYYYPFGQRPQGGQTQQQNQTPPPQQQQFHSQQAPQQYAQQQVPHQNQRAPQQTQPQQRPEQSAQPLNQEGTFVRHVPIVIESRKVPPKPKPQPTQQQAPQPQQPHQQTDEERQVPIPMPGPPESNSEASEQQSDHPMKNDSISKIQAIQKEVMELMLAVEKFKGNSRSDKDYIWLDEMLTRNLIKLDDIETDGKENIRLARKEAIKCIQASLCVLEMKADGVIPDEQQQNLNNNNSNNTEENAKSQQEDDQPNENEIHQEAEVKKNNTEEISKKVEENKSISEQQQVKPEKTENTNINKNDEAPKPESIIPTDTPQQDTATTTLEAPVIASDIKDEKSKETDEQQTSINDVVVDSPKKKKIVKKVVKKSVPSSFNDSQSEISNDADANISDDAKNLNQNETPTADGNKNDEIVETTNTDEKK